MNHRISAGNSLVEYILPAAVIGVVLIVGSLTLVSSMQQGLSGQFGGESVNDNRMSIRALGHNPNLTQLRLTLQDGTVIVIPQYPRSLTTSLETVGANGTTEELLTVLESLIAQMEAAGKLTPTQALALKKLANQGHAVANLESLLESAAQKAGNDNEKFQNMTFSYNGRELTSTGLAITIGTNAGELTRTNANAKELLTRVVPGSELAKFVEGNTYCGKEGAEFIELFTQAKASGALSDPAVSSLVSQLTGDIFSMSQGFASVVYFAAQNEPHPLLGHLISPNDLSSATASVVTHANSGGICEASTLNQDSGISCI